ncbi:hypothetical protein O6H91_07G108900 [Diphasiastrum complanatum]|uniref:Uncharacterized protein n=1 Tax=Diphasiastrum complanatum TaxID=34168 RepID=A0ACC2D8E8_DIPCM|nr:hypothetical protein O6H91_07G108900 [Diphasiastrum complanatum]
MYKILKFTGAFPTVKLGQTDGPHLPEVISQQRGRQPEIVRREGDSQRGSSKRERHPKSDGMREAGISIAYLYQMPVFALLSDSCTSMNGCEFAFIHFFPSGYRLIVMYEMLPSYNVSGNRE